MSFLARLAAYMLQRILTIGGKALYEAVTAFVEKQKQVQKEKENLKNYQDAVKKGDRDEILKKERNLLNGE